MNNTTAKIMIADDDPGILDSVGIMLEYRGYEVLPSSKNTLNQVQAELPDLLLLDIWMSGQDGIEICKALKGNERTREMPVLMISASRHIENSAFDAGADDFLAKPFEMEQLFEKIEYLLKK
ncbi:response regulator [Desertivirga arenae]|uniref:response regulator n=1 Tax=Desertivirga arenae TaxID=2810309 RepID=UPI001A962674|nr:response regulator [Pedobacter sp. SYSU D00823]